MVYPGGVHRIGYRGSGYTIQHRQLQGSRQSPGPGGPGAGPLASPTRSVGTWPWEHSLFRNVPMSQSSFPLGSVESLRNPPGILLESSWNPPESSGILRNPPESSGILYILRNPPESSIFSGILYILRNPLYFSGILYILRNPLYSAIFSHILAIFSHILLYLAIFWPYLAIFWPYLAYI